MNLSSQAKERLAVQQAKYFSSLSSKKSRIQNCWNQIQRSGWSKERLDTLKTEVHRLSGSAGSYGLFPLGGAAQNLDQMLAMETEMSSISSSVTELVTALLNAFDEAIVSKSVSATSSH